MRSLDDAGLTHAFAVRIGGTISHLRWGAWAGEGGWLEGDAAAIGCQGELDQRGGVGGGGDRRLEIPTQACWAKELWKEARLALMWAMEVYTAS